MFMLINDCKLFCVCIICVYVWCVLCISFFGSFYNFFFAFANIFEVHFCFGRNVCSLLSFITLSLSLSLQWEWVRVWMSVLPVSAVSFSIWSISIHRRLIDWLVQLTPCCTWKIVHQFSVLMATFCSWEMRMCSRRLYLFLKFLLQSSHLRGGWGVCWVRICLQRFTVVITILQNWHSVHLLLGESKNIQKNRTNYTIIWAFYFSILLYIYLCPISVFYLLSFFLGHHSRFYYIFNINSILTNTLETYSTPKKHN